MRSRKKVGEWGIGFRCTRGTNTSLDVRDEINIVKYISYMGGD
jgi:hypothetical protein